MARYTYHGPTQTVSLKVATTKGKDGVEVSRFKDFTLMVGAEPVDLPDGNSVVASMVDAGHLQPADTPKPDRKADQGKK